MKVFLHYCENNGDFYLELGLSNKAQRIMKFVSMIARHHCYIVINNF